MNERERLRLIDVFRLICVYYFVVYHAWMIFFNQNTSAASGFAFFEFVESQVPFLSYHAGLFIIAISFFLFGWQGKPLPLWRWLLFLIGICLTQYNGSPEDSALAVQSWKWGLFSFIAVAYLILWLSQKISKTFQALFLLSFSFLFLIQPYQISALYTVDTHPWIKQALTGDLIAPKLWTGWFLVPWLAYPLLFAGLGILARRFESRLRKFHLLLDPAFILALGWSLYSYIASHPPLNVGPGFEAGIFHKDALEILPIILFPLLIFRWSFLATVQTALERRSLRWISKSQWNQKFWLCYMLHLCWFFGLSATPWVDSFKTSPAIEIIILFAYILPEFYGRAFDFSFQIWAGWIAKWKTSVSRIPR